MLQGHLITALNISDKFHSLCSELYILCSKLSLPHRCTCVYTQTHRGNPDFAFRINDIHEWYLHNLFPILLIWKFWCLWGYHLYQFLGFICKGGGIAQPSFIHPKSHNPFKFLIARKWLFICNWIRDVHLEIKVQTEFPLFFNIFNITSLVAKYVDTIITIKLCRLLLFWWLVDSLVQGRDSDGRSQLHR